MTGFAWFLYTWVDEKRALVKAMDTFSRPCMVQETGYGLVERLRKAGRSQRPAMGTQLREVSDALSSSLSW